MKKCYFVLLLMLSFMLAACAPNLSSNTLSGAEVGTASKAAPGVIISKRTVHIDNNSGVGGAAGVGTGAAAGSMIGGSTAVNVIGAIGGAVVGGVLGNSIDKSLHAQNGFEYIVRLKNGNIVSVTQAQDTNFNVGQHVIVVFGPRARLIPSTGF